LTNSSLIKNNIIKYNKSNGLFIKTNSYDNIVENNTLIGNGYGIGLLEDSNNNTIRNNKIHYNILSPEPIYEDDSSKSNFITND
jgi:parallel beta-helix repeat protein